MDIRLLLAHFVNVFFYMHRYPLISMHRKNAPTTYEYQLISMHIKTHMNENAPKTYEYPWIPMHIQNAIYA